MLRGWCWWMQSWRAKLLWVSSSSSSIWLPIAWLWRSCSMPIPASHKLLCLHLWRRIWGIYWDSFFLYFIQYLSLSGRWHTLLQRLWTWRLSFLWFIHIHSGLSHCAMAEATDHYTLHGNRWPVPVQEREWLSWECQLWVWQAIQKIQVQVQKVVWGRWVVLLWAR